MTTPYPLAWPLGVMREPAPRSSLSEQAIQVLEVAIKDRGAAETVAMNVGDLCVIIGLLRANPPASPGAAMLDVSAPGDADRRG